MHFLEQRAAAYWRGALQPEGTKWCQALKRSQCGRANLPVGNLGSVQGNRKVQTSLDKVALLWRCNAPLLLLSCYRLGFLPYGSNVFSHVQEGDQPRTGTCTVTCKQYFSKLSDTLLNPGLVCPSADICITSRHRERINAMLMIGVL